MDRRSFLKAAMAAAVCVELLLAPEPKRQPTIKAYSVEPGMQGFGTVHKFSDAHIGEFASINFYESGSL